MPKGTVLPANPNFLEDPDDLVQLSFMNELSVLHNLYCRYSQSKSYTKAGPVLLAMSPFAEVRGNELVSGCGKKPRVSPDIYYWAKDAFIAMMNEKVMVECLTNLGGGSALEEKLRHTHVILEDLGNAKTSKEANFSQFMRVIQLAKEERSFHIMWVVIAVVEATERHEALEKVEVGEEVELGVAPDPQQMKKSK
ncbi:hypothetical protein Syun_028105 [Stephania yunnanensis]|uniref:Myosin motor domain-containing protein n=1 Tax=Stephania yunnanensis TaxID=152371 RepID=A0AAP0HNF3_9MAGN